MEQLEHFIHRFSFEPQLAYAETYRSRTGAERLWQSSTDQLTTFAQIGKNKWGNIITLSYPYLPYLAEARECLTTMRGPLDKVPDAPYFRVALFCNLLAHFASLEECRYVVIYGGGPKYNEGGVLDDIKHNPALVQKLLEFHRKNRSFQRERREISLDYGKGGFQPHKTPPRPWLSSPSVAVPTNALPSFSSPALVVDQKKSITASPASTSPSLAAA